MSTVNRFLTNINKKISSLKRERIKILSPKMEEIVLITSSILFIFFIYFAITYNSILEKKRIESIDSFLSNNQTVLLKNYILNQVKSPYLEYDYIVKDNDTIEKILKKFSIKNDEIIFIVKKIKKMNLSNIVPNQKINFILKRGKASKNIEIVKINYPLSKTTFVQIDKRKEKIEIKKNITELFKKDIVVESKISNNFLSSPFKIFPDGNLSF